MAALATHVYRSFGVLIVFSERSPFYDAGAPLLEPSMAALFMLGMREISAQPLRDRILAYAYDPSR